MKNNIGKTLKKFGITEWGMVNARIYDERIEVMRCSVPFVKAGAEERINPFLIMENAKSIIVFLIPYKADGKRTNLSCYAKGIDYHIIADKICSEVIKMLEEYGFCGVGFCDNGVLDDRYLAYLAGLGFYGKNGLIINKRFGTYTFIGYVITDCPLEEDKPLNDTCKGCDACIKSCPGDAISERGINYSSCVSYITQKKGELSEEEKSIVRKSGYVWGCDICQETCPHNMAAEQTTIDEFLCNKIEYLKHETLTNKEFMHKYKSRAFAWRGAGVIRRNIEISENDN